MASSAPATARLPAATAHPLDRAAWASLTGPHAHFALGTGLARRYPADVSPFAAVSSFDDQRAWADLRALYTPDEVVGLAGPPGFTRSIPPGWGLEGVVPGVQLVATPALLSALDDEAFLIGPVDAPQALELALRTEPGPFRPAPTSSAPTWGSAARAA